jgi:hypothetical protein
VSVKHEPVSVSLFRETLRELRAVAARKGTSASKIVQSAVENHLRCLRARALDGADPLVRVVPKHLSPGWGPADPEAVIASVRKLDGAEVVQSRIKPPSPRRHTIGAAVLVFEERPWSDQMFTKFEQWVRGDIALLWAEELERIEVERGARADNR